MSCTESSDKIIYSSSLHVFKEKRNRSATNEGVKAVRKINSKSIHNTLKFKKKFTDRKKKINKRSRNEKKKFRLWEKSGEETEIEHTLYSLYDHLTF